MSLRQSYAELEVDVRRSLSQSLEEYQKGVGS